MHAIEAALNGGCIPATTIPARMTDKIYKYFGHEFSLVIYGLILTVNRGRFNRRGTGTEITKKLRDSPLLD
jgi:hypothetical protein